MMKTIRNISGDLDKVGSHPPLLSRAKFYSLAAAFAGVVIPAAVFINTKINDELDREASLAQQHSTTIRDCMVIHSQDICVRAFPDRVALECKIVPTLTTSVSMAPAYTTAAGWMTQRGRGMTVSIADAPARKLVCN